MTAHKHVLLVDDEEEIVAFMEHFLRRFKIATVRALSGEEALNLYDKEKIDLVFLDINLKAMDGFSVLKEFKAMNPDIKVVMITGISDKASQEKAMQFGALDYISKPLDLGDLRDKLEKYI